MSTTPVVTINTDAGPVRINREDFNSEIHTLADKQDDDFVPFAPVTDTAPVEPPAPPAPVVPVVPVTPPVTPPAPPAPPAPVEKVEAFVTKAGNKWHLADKEGKSVDGVDYDTKAAAEAAQVERDKPATV